MSHNYHNPALTPELRDWIDSVIVPILVKEYQSKNRTEPLAKMKGIVIKFPVPETVSPEVAP